MDPYLLERPNLPGRRVHPITGIARIGASFCFGRLDPWLRAGAPR